MHLMYFTEQPMSAYPSDIGLATGHTALMFSNKYSTRSPAAGSTTNTSSITSWSTSSASSLGQYGVNLDLDARRPARWPDEIRARAAGLVVPVG
jgi:hypothetical protein